MERVSRDRLCLQRGLRQRERDSRNHRARGRLPLIVLVASNVRPPTRKLHLSILSVVLALVFVAGVGVSIF